MAFGTFRNPRGFPAATGFWDGASSPVLDMLRFADVSEPHVEKRAATRPAGA